MFHTHSPTLNSDSACTGIFLHFAHLLRQRQKYNPHFFSPGEPPSTSNVRPDGGCKSTSRVVGRACDGTTSGMIVAALFCITVPVPARPSSVRSACSPFLLPQCPHLRAHRGHWTHHLQLRCELRQMKLVTAARSVSLRGPCRPDTSITQSDRAPCPHNPQCLYR